MNKRYATIVMMLAVGLTGWATQTLRADDLAIEGLDYNNVRITGLDGQTLKVLVSGRTLSVDLNKLTKLEIQNLPQYSQAVKALESKQYKKAVALLDEAERQLTDSKAFLKPLIVARRIEALDGKGQFDRAVREYVSLVMVNGQPYYLERYPRQIPADKEVRRQALQQITFAVKSVRDDRVRTRLDALAKAITDAGDTATQADVDQQPKNTGNGLTGNIIPQDDTSTGGTRSPAMRHENALKGIQKNIADQEYDKALEIIRNLFAMEANRGVDVPDEELTFLRAQAQAGKKMYMASALNYMRVAIHWADSPNAVPALVQAGQQFKLLGDVKSAKRVWEAAQQRAGDANIKNQIGQMIQSISAK